MAAVPVYFRRVINGTQHGPILQNRTPPGGVGVSPFSTNGIHFNPADWATVPAVPNPGTIPTNRHGAVTWPPPNSSELLRAKWPCRTLADFTNQGLNVAEAKTMRARLGYVREKDQLVCLGASCWAAPLGLGWGKDPIVRKYCTSSANVPCSHTYGKWVARSARFSDRFNLDNAGSMGIGVFARADRPGWTQGQVIGAYTGKLVPLSHPTDFSYVLSTPVGAEPRKEDIIAPAPTACIDARECGNFTRYINHSCVPNCLYIAARVGERRVMAIVVSAPTGIAPGAQLFVDYGDNYFETNGIRIQNCNCGEAICRFPPGTGAPVGPPVGPPTSPPVGPTTGPTPGPKGKGGTKTGAGVAKVPTRIQPPRAVKRR